VEENLDSLDVALSDGQLARLDAAAAAVSGDRNADLGWVSAGRE
jgi:aryl-alcohol dehydrogenase-like predicted oxidoreductase